MDNTPTGADTGTPAPMTVSDAAAKLAALRAKPKEQEPEAPKEEAQEQNSEVEAQASAESSETETEVTEEAEGHETEAQTTDAETSEPEMLTALADVAQKLGLDESKLYDIKIKTKVDGVDGEATLAQLVKSYQFEGHLNRKSMELTDLKKEAEKRLESIETERQQRIGTLEQAAQITQHLLLGEYKNVNWEELKRADSIGYLEKKAQFEEYNHSLNQINAAIHAEKQRDQQANHEKLKSFIKEQQDKLVNAIPEWKDQAVQKKEYSELLDFLRNEFQFSKEEIDTILDHRAYLIARDAKKYRELQKKNPKIENKDRTPPKIVKPGSTKPNPQAVRTAEAHKSFMRNKDVKSAAALLKSLRK